MESETKKYAFVLGREQDLCLSELRAVLARFCFNPEQSGDRSGRTGFDFSILSVSKNVAFINLSHTNGEQSELANVESTNFNNLVSELISVLGGTTKIFEIIGQPKDLKQQIKDFIVEKIPNVSGRFNFGFSAYGKHNPRSLNALGLNIKKELKGVGSLRFIALKETELSTIISSKNHLVREGLEIGFFDEGIGVLVAVTDPEGWSERDYDKPASDKHSGMLPPKLARAMLNIALGASSQYAVHSTQRENAPDHSLKIENCKIENSQATLVVDPFCGSGNVVLEAMMLGLDVLGSDVSERAVEDSQLNTSWLSEKLKVKGQKPSSIVKVIHEDATDPELLSALNLEFSTGDYGRVVVVAEPYLGEPKKYAPTLNAVKGEYAKIKELYLEFFRNFSQLSTLNSKLSIVFCLVFPLVETAEGKQYSLYFDSVDEIRKIGYTELKLPLVYGRDYQVVKREIALLKLT